MGSISVDRFVSVVFPLRYTTLSGKSKFLYIFVYLFPPWVYMLYVTWLFYNYSLQNAEKPVYCMPTDYVDLQAREITYPMLMYINFVMIFMYSLIWILLKFKVVTQNEVEKRIYISLSVLMLVTFFCWLPVPVLVTYVFPSLQAQMAPNAVNVLQRGLLQLNKIAQGVNAPILYICSIEYRKAMQREFRRFFSK